MKLKCQRLTFVLLSYGAKDPKLRALYQVADQPGPVVLKFLEALRGAEKAVLLPHPLAQLVSILKFCNLPEDMASSDGDVEALAHPQYWNERYSKSDGTGQTHEWFRTYSDLEPFFAKYLFELYGPQQQPKILHLGTGDSTIPRDLLDYGYRHQICVDFSSVLIELMAARGSDGITWHCADVRNMSIIDSSSIDVAFDKGTLDAMIHGSPWDPPEDVKENAGRYMKEVARVLKDNGVFLYVTYRQPHFVKPLLNQYELWNLTAEALQSSGNSFEYYAFVLKKA